jgi:PAS domain S-box-containing protein
MDASRKNASSAAARRVTTSADRDGALLGSVARGLATDEALQAILDRIARGALATAGADAAHVERVAGGDEIEIVAIAGRGSPPMGTRMPLPGSLAAMVLASDEPEVVDFGGLKRRPIGRLLTETCGECSALVLPLLAEGESLGALILLRAVDSEPFGDDAIQRVRIFADMAGLALRRELLLAQQQAARESLTRLGERYKAMYDENPTMFITTSPEGTILSVNSFGAQLLGYTVEELLQRPIEELIHPADRAGYAEHIRQVLAHRGEVCRTEYRKVRRDGSTLWAREATRAVERLDGTLDLLNVCEDISDRVRAEQELRFLANAGRALATSLDWETTLRTVAELAVPHLADWCAIDIVEDGELRRMVVTHSDPAMREAAKEYQQRYPPAPDAQRGAAHVVRTGEPELIPEVTEDVLRAVARDDEQLQMLQALGFRSAMVVPLQVHSRVLGAVTLIAAESHRAYDPADLRTAELVASRAALAVEKARLFREAQAASHARDEVLSIVSHDLRNPLNTILLSAGFLLDSAPETDRRSGAQHLEIIRRQADQMSRMIQDLLDVGRIEAGGLPVEERREDVAKLVSDAAEIARPLAEKKKLRLHVQTEDALPAVCADRERILQVFSNLLGNATKFTPEGGTISLRAEQRDRVVRFSVSDTGSGIAEDDLPHIFQRFYQARKTRRGGAGLGLSIAKGIVEAHGGCIGVTSKAGAGSTFYFEIPVNRQPARRPD